MAKSFAWSFSKLKNFESCPKRHYEVDIAKNIKEEEGEALLWGNRVHKEMAIALTKNTPLPAEMSEYQRWVDKVYTGAGSLLVEQKYAITKEFSKASWFSPSAWYRGIGDVVRIATPVALILDWKTGKILEDSVQLALMAQCVFAHYPDVSHVRSEYVWLKDDCQTSELFTRDHMPGLWEGLLGRVGAMAEAASTNTYPPKPGYLCKRYCPVASCPYHGKGL